MNNYDDLFTANGEKKDSKTERPFNKEEWVAKKQQERIAAFEMLDNATMSMTAFAANDDPLTVVNNLSDFIFGLIRAIGLIMLGFGIVQVGLSLKSHDPSQRANGFLTVAGGIVITFAKEILNLITG